MGDQELFKRPAARAKRRTGPTARTTRDPPPKNTWVLSDRLGITKIEAVNPRDERNLVLAAVC